MKTIAEPKEYIDKLWGKQRIRKEDTYRMMRYVFRVDQDGQVLLHNVVTGQLVCLEKGEVEVVGNLPQKFSPAMDNLIAAHYLVPDNYDEHQQTVKLRTVLRRLEVLEGGKSFIRQYTILPTTACNARCYYCYERDVYTATMTEEVAEDAVKFITEHAGENGKVSIRWFGGEPTVASERIDQISKGLLRNSVSYTSTMTTNGYLFDEAMVEKAKSIWNLRHLMISVDGTEQHYNAIKSYVNPKDNPYRRVLRNVGLLLDHGIRVDLRMNFDLGNYQDFEEFIRETKERFHGNKLLQVYAFPVKGEYPDQNGCIAHGSPEWFDEKIAELNGLAQESGCFFRELELPYLFFSTCKAGDPASVVIGPRGELARCLSIFERKDQVIGSVKEGIRDQNYREIWSQFADLKECRDCIFFPSCVLIEKCPGKGQCFLKETHRQYEAVIKKTYNQWLLKKHV